jgi:hypothetical protein
MFYVVRDIRVLIVAFPTLFYYDTRYLQLLLSTIFVYYKLETMFVKQTTQCSLFFSAIVLTIPFNEYSVMYR